MVQSSFGLNFFLCLPEKSKGYGKLHKSLPSMTSSTSILVKQCFLRGLLNANTSGKASPCSSMNQSHQLLIIHVQQLVQVHTTKGELAESPLLLHRSSLFSILKWWQKKAFKIPIATYPHSKHHNAQRLHSITIRTYHGAAVRFFQLAKKEHVRKIRNRAHCTTVCFVFFARKFLQLLRYNVMLTEPLLTGYHQPGHSSALPVWVWN